MEKTRVSLLQRIGTFFKGLSNPEEDAIIDENKLSKKEQEIVKKLQEMDNTRRIEDELVRKIKVEKPTIDTKKAKGPGPSNGKIVQPRVQEGRERD